MLLGRFLQLEFYQTFLRDVAWPFSLSARQVEHFIAKFEGTSASAVSAAPLALCSSAALHQLLCGLVDIGTELWAVEGVPHDFLCPITLERMSDPVEAADGHVYERSAIEEWLASGHTMSPFDTSNTRALVSPRLVPCVALKARLDRWEEGLDLTSFLEYYLLDVVFQPLYRPSLTRGLLREVIQILAGKAVHKASTSEGDSKTRQHVAANLLPCGNAIEGVLKELFLLQAASQGDQEQEQHQEQQEHRLHLQGLCEEVDCCLEEELCASMREKQYLDTPMTVAYVSVRQEQLLALASSHSHSSPLESFPVDEQLLRRGVDYTEAGAETERGGAGAVRCFLDAVATMRCLLTATAAALCRHVDQASESGGEGEGEGGLHLLLARVNSLLDDSDYDTTASASSIVVKEGGGGGGLMAMTHSMRMYFLKLIAQSRGVSFLRQVLLTPPLNGAVWLQRWRDGLGVAACSGSSGADTIGFTRFLGSNLLPRVNPFLGLPQYRSVQAQVAQVLQSGDISALSEIFATAITTTTADSDTDSASPSMSMSPGEAEARWQQCRFLCGLLLLALFNEVALLSMLPMEAVQSQLQTRARDLERWILQQGQGQSLGGPVSGRMSLSAAAPLACLSASERHCLVFFGLGRFSATASAPAPAPAQERLLLSSRSSPAALLHLRVMVQLVATALMSPPSHPAAFLHTLIFRPGAMLATSTPSATSTEKTGGEGDGSYLPTMPEDMMKMAQTVMGGRWYACPYGHPFYVDLCGRPTVIQTCAECGAKIGGDEPPKSPSP